MPSDSMPQPADDGTRDTGEQPAIVLARSADTPKHSDLWQPPPIKRSTLLAAATAALTALAGVVSGSSYIGGSTADGETRALVQETVDVAVERMEAQAEKSERRLGEKFDRATLQQNSRLDKIDAEVQEIKLDVRDMQRDIRDLSK